MSDSDCTARRVRVEKGIYKRPDGRLEIGFRDASGKQRWKTLPSDYGIMAARSALTEEVSKRNRGEKIPDDPRITFNKCAEEWLTTKVSRLRPATQQVYSSHLNHLRDYFGKWKMVDISVADIAKYVAKKEKQGYKGWTIKGHLTVLSAVFTYAERYKNFSARNPVQLLDRAERPAQDAGIKRALSHSELQRLLAATTDQYQPVVAVAAQTGMRQSEVLGLLWTDFDAFQMTLTVSGQVDRQGKRIPTKTERSMRTVEITPALARELSNLPRKSVFIFCTETGKAFYQRAVGNALQRAANNAGLGSVSFHELRHSHASALIADGWDAQQVADRLGDSIATVHSVYSHAFDAAKRGAERRNRLANLYDGSSAAGSIVEARDGTIRQSHATDQTAEIIPLQVVRNGRQ